MEPSLSLVIAWSVTLVNRIRKRKPYKKLDLRRFFPRRRVHQSAISSTICTPDTKPIRWGPINAASTRGMKKKTVPMSTKPPAVHILTVAIRTRSSTLTSACGSEPTRIDISRGYRRPRRRRNTGRLRTPPIILRAIRPASDRAGLGTPGPPRDSAAPVGGPASSRGPASG